MLENILTLFFYIAYLFSFVYSYKINWKGRNWYAIVSFTLLLGLRGCGIDYHGYKILYNLLLGIDADLFDARYYHAEVTRWSTVQFEWFYLIIIKVLKYFNASSVFFFLIIAFCQIILLDIFLRRFSINARMFLAFFFFTTLIFVETFNAMRQFIAFFGFALITTYIESRDWKRFFGYGLLLYFLHSSAIILLPLYIFIHKDVLKNKTLQVSIYLFVVLFTSIFLDQLKAFLDGLYMIVQDTTYFQSKYLLSDEQEKSLAVSGLVHFYRFSLFLFLLINSDDFKNHYRRLGIVFYNLSFIGLILLELSFNMGVYRINYYFFYNIFVVLGLMTFQNLSKSKNQLMKFFTLYIVLLSFAWFCNSVIKGANECAPYVLSNELVQTNEM